MRGSQRICGDLNQGHFKIAIKFFYEDLDSYPR